MKVFPELNFHFFITVFIAVLFLIILLIGTVLTISFLQLSRLKNTSSWSLLIDEQLSQLIIDGSTASAYSNELKNLAQLKPFRHLFSQKLIAAEKRFSGIASKEIKKIYYDFNLERDAYDKLKSAQPHIIAGGIQELAVMQVRHAAGPIAHFVHHQVEIVRQEAQYALVALEGFAGLAFLSGLTEKVSEWQQLRILRVLPGPSENETTKVAELLRSANSSVVIFSLRIIKRFQIIKLYPEVLEAMNYHDNAVKKEAVKTFLVIDDPNTAEHLLKIYPNQDREIQQEILGGLKQLKEPALIPFFKQELHNQPENTLRKICAEALFILKEEKFLHELRSAKNIDPDLKQILAHVLQLKNDRIF